MEFFGAGGRTVIFDDAAAGHGNGDNFGGNRIFYVLRGGSGAEDIRRIRRIRRIRIDFNFTV